MKTTIIKSPEIIPEAVEKKEKKYRVIILTVRPNVTEKSDVYHTSSVIEKESKKLGLEVYLVFLDGAHLRKDEDGNMFLKIYFLR